MEIISSQGFDGLDLKSLKYKDMNKLLSGVQTNKDTYIAYTKHLSPTEIILLRSDGQIDEMRFLIIPYNMEGNFFKRDCESVINIFDAVHDNRERIVRETNFGMSHIKIQESLSETIVEYYLGYLSKKETIENYTRWLSNQLSLSEGLIEDLVSPLRDSKLIDFKSQFNRYLTVSF